VFFSIPPKAGVVAAYKGDWKLWGFTTGKRGDFGHNGLGR